MSNITAPPFVDSIEVATNGQVVMFVLKFNNSQIGSFVITREHWLNLVQDLETRFAEGQSEP